MNEAASVMNIQSSVAMVVSRELQNGETNV